MNSTQAASKQAQQLKLGTNWSFCILLNIFASFVTYKKWISKSHLYLYSRMSGLCFQLSLADTADRDLKVCLHKRGTVNSYHWRGTIQKHFFIFHIRILEEPAQDFAILLKDWMLNLSTWQGHKVSGFKPLLALFWKAPKGTYVKHKRIEGT